MRTTVDLEPDLLERLRLEATNRRVAFKELLNNVIRRGLAETNRRTRAPYALPRLRLGATRKGVDLDRALRVADALEGGEVARGLTDDR